MKNKIASDHFVFEELEKRILFSADIGVLAPELPTPQTLVQDLPQYQLPVAPATAAAVATATESGAQQASARREVVFIDSAVDNAQSLADELGARQDSTRTLAIVMLAADRDGIAQIGDYLATQQDVDAIHIISHGADGELQLGLSRLNAASLAANAISVSGWGAALSAGGDILLYGCDVAATASGQQFIDNLSRLTGADIAASNDLTGSATRQGNWELEYSHGVIETRVAADAAMQVSYSGILGIFTVSNNNDSGAGSLRQAIIDANAASGSDTIDFSIGGLTINLASILPDITDTVSIDGRTASGYGGAPVIEINGSGLAGNGLFFTGGASGSSLYGLSIINFGGDGIHAAAAAGNLTIQANYIGLRADGETGYGNQNGIFVASSGNLIGGNLAGQRNVISASVNDGVNISDGSNNVVSGNYVGTNASGTSAVGNGYSGIMVFGGAGTVVGGTAAGSGNLASGNTYSGIYVGSGASNVLIAGNWAGLDASGSLAIGNHGDGIRIDGANGVTVGGTNALARNVSSGNQHDGINILGSNNTILGNYAGLNVAGTAVVANTLSGIAIDGASGNNVVGGTAPGSRNVLSGNGDAGLWVGADVTGLVVQGNYMGLDAAGTAALGNDRGISIVGTVGVIIGGITPAARNVVSGNIGDGIWSIGSSAVIEGNYIGLGADGASTVGNGFSGIALYGANDTVGSTVTGSRNYIGGNGGHGIHINGPGGTVIQNNLIGLDANGNIASNGLSGIHVASATGVQIGGTSNEAANTIIGNTGPGVSVGSNATGVSILHNAINYNGGLGIDLDATGVTPNDTGDGDSGANNLQNFPVIVAAQTSETHSAIQGTLNSNPGRTYIIEFFAGFDPDASGYGQGASYIGTISVTTDASGNVSFDAPITGLLNDNTWISATATDTTTNETSEFSLAVLSTVLNNAPTGTDKTIAEREDVPYTFAAGDFGFDDPDANNPNAFMSVLIDALPASGTLTLNGTAVNAGVEIAVTEIDAGGLVYTPAANINGSNVASFTFRVRDDGGTDHGGSDTDATARTMRFDLAAVNDAPTGNSSGFAIGQNESYTFSRANFGFADTADSPANNFSAIVIVSTPANGALTLGGVVVIAGQRIAVIDLDNGQLVFAPTFNDTTPASFSFQVQDDGGTANGGMDTDPTPKTLTIYFVAFASPVLTPTAGALNVSAGSAAVAVDAGISVSDADSASLASGSVSISGNFNPSQDVLALNANPASMGNISASYDAGTGVLSLVSAGNSATVAQWQAALRAVTYQNTAANPSTAIRTLSISVSDGSAAPATATREVHINSLVAGDIAVLGFDSQYYGDVNGDGAGDGHWAIVVLRDLRAGTVIHFTDAGINASRDAFIANPSLDSHLTWTLTSDIAAGTILSMDTSNGDNFADLNGSAAGKGGLSDYGTLSGRLGGTQSGNGPTPPGGDQLIIYQGQAGSVTGSTFIYAFSNSRDGANSGTGGWQTGGAATGESQSFLPPGLADGVTAVALTTSTGTSMGTGVANAGSANYGFASMRYAGPLSGTRQQLLLAIADPERWEGGNAGGYDYAVGPGSAYASNFSVLVVSLATTPGSFDYTEGNVWSRVDNGLILASDNGVTIASATVSIAGNYRRGEDVLVNAADPVTMGNIVASFDHATGIMTLSSAGNSATVAQWQEALRSIGYGNASENPDLALRTVVYTVTTLAGDTASASRVVAVSSVNDAPVIVVPASTPAVFIENGPAVVVSADLTLSDVDNTTLASATVQIIAGKTDGDSLLFANDGSSMGNIVRVADSDPATLRLISTGATATLAQWQAALRSVSFLSTSDSPGPAERVVHFFVNDGVSASTAPVRLIKVVAVNDAPVGSGRTIELIENAPYTLAASDFGFQDGVDGGANQFHSVLITTLPAIGKLSVDGLRLTAGAIVLRADIDAGKLVFDYGAGSAGKPAATFGGNTGFTFQVRDDGGTENGGVDTDPVAREMRFAVTAVNRAPSGADHVVQMTDSKAHVFAAADFGFSDGTGASANNFLSVSIVSVPATGTLSLNGIALKATSVVLKSEIDAGKLIYTPVAYSPFREVVGFSFRVRDDGGVANGGLDTDPQSRSMKLDIASTFLGTTGSVTPASASGFILTGNLVQDGGEDGNAARAAAAASSPPSSSSSSPSSSAAAAAASTTAGAAAQSAGAPAKRVDILVTAGVHALAIETDASIIRANVLRNLGDKAFGFAPNVIADQGVSTTAPQAGSAFKTEMVVQPAAERRLDPAWRQKAGSSDSPARLIAPSSLPALLENRQDYSTARATAHRIETAIAVSALGTVWVVARKAALVASLLSTVPAWLRLDPLPILGGDQETGEDEAGNDDSQAQTEDQAQAESVEHLFIVGDKSTLQA